MARNTKIHNVSVAYNVASKRYAVLVNGTHALHSQAVKEHDELVALLTNFHKSASEGKKFDPKDTRIWADISGMNGWKHHPYTVAEHDVLSAKETTS